MSHTNGGVATRCHVWSIKKEKGGVYKGRGRTKKVWKLSQCGALYSNGGKGSSEAGGEKNQFF